MERKPSAIHNSWLARDSRFTAFWLLLLSCPIAGYNAVPKTGRGYVWCTSKRASRLPTGLFPPTMFFLLMYVALFHSPIRPDKNNEINFISSHTRKISDSHFFFVFLPVGLLPESLLCDTKWMAYKLRQKSEHSRAFFASPLPSRNGGRREAMMAFRK